MRCARRIVELAQHLVPDIEAARTEDGEIIEATTRDALRNHPPRSGDMIVCRTNAPLIRLYFHINRTPAWPDAVVLGDDLGARLLRIVDKLKAPHISALSYKLKQWHERRLGNLEKEKATHGRFPTSPASSRTWCLIKVILN